MHISTPTPKKTVMSTQLSFSGIHKYGWKMNTADTRLLKPLKWVITGAFIKTGVCSLCASKCVRAEMSDGAVTAPLDPSPQQLYQV